MVAREKDPYAHYVVGDARALPFRNGFYDVVCTDVLEHIINYEVVLKEIVSLMPNFIYLRFPDVAT
jgi:ubiquinone/menaquinone biosynthesis C-methylase UbiE